VSGGDDEDEDEEGGGRESAEAASLRRMLLRGLLQSESAARGAATSDALSAPRHGARGGDDLGHEAPHGGTCFGIVDEIVTFALFGNPPLVEQARQLAMGFGIERFTPGKHRFDIVGDQVIDTGPGIAPEYLERIFERYFQVPGQTGKGFGIGLSMCRSYAMLMGGSVQAMSSPGQGATFRARIPFATAPG
jgi:hypothetical protein